MVHRDWGIMPTAAMELRLEAARLGRTATFERTRGDTTNWPITGIFKREWRNRGKCHPDSGLFGAQSEASPASSQTGENAPERLLTDVPRPPGGWGRGRLFYRLDPLVLRAGKAGLPTNSGTFCLDRGWVHENSYISRPGARPVPASRSRGGKCPAAPSAVPADS
jgi:hypothetical protein